MRADEGKRAAGRRGANDTNTMHKLKRSELKAIRDAAIMTALAVQSTCPSRSFMGAGLTYETEIRITKKFAICGLRTLRNMRQAAADRNLEAAENAHNGAWGSHADEMEQRFRALAAESQKEADHFERLAVIVETGGLPPALITNDESPARPKP